MDEQAILMALPDAEHPHERLRLCDEHGGLWVTCLDCGAQWGVHESSSGLDFEPISDGDESCMSAALAAEGC